VSVFFFHSSTAAGRLAWPLGASSNVNAEHSSSPHPIYDRQLLLSEAKRNAVLELWEVERYGIDSYRDVDYVSIYDMRPADWHAKGVRLMGRTAVECTRDALARAIGSDVADAAAKRPEMKPALVVDLFAGSGNTLYWLLRSLPGAIGLGFELDARVFRLTRQNLAVVGSDIEILNVDYRSALRDVCVTVDQLLVAFIAPPWGDALDKVRGLDLRRTHPPLRDIVTLLFDSFPHNRLLCAIQTYEVVSPPSLEELRTCFDWSASRTYRLNAPGQNHGVLLGSKRWVPTAA
jgi:hypothetical protein